MNEPEWIIRDIRSPKSGLDQSNSVTQKEFYQFGSKISDAVHALTHQKVTLGIHHNKHSCIYNSLIYIYRFCLFEVE